MHPDERAASSEDLHVISSSLNHVVDLLRGVLEYSKAGAQTLQMDLVDTAVLHDVFEPVKTFLHRRDDTFDFIIDCPDDLIIRADRMRLRQVILNLAGNSKKFVEKGYIRLSAEVLDGKIRLSVEDSGTGIPKEKQKSIFQKFQQSLDTLNQGTGLGLALCKNLVDLMGGTIWLDEEYCSSILGCPGTRFVVDLEGVSVNQQLNKAKEVAIEGSEVPATSENVSDKKPSILPEKWNVLVTDDDMVLRKLIRRSLVRIAPSWIITEACNGETAIEKAENERFDLIFLDQYMASVEKQLLGTETCRMMRAKGVDSILCGLSANDKREIFMQAGADGFMIK